MDGNRPASWSCTDPSHIGPEYAPEYAHPVIIGPCADCVIGPCSCCIPAATICDVCGTVAHAGTHPCRFEQACSCWRGQACQS